MPMPKRIVKPSKRSAEMAKFLAMVVRNAMEDYHHKYLSDEQMKELNPIVRNAIYTGLQALSYCDRSEGARSFVEFQTMSIPRYWEQPELLADFEETIGKMDTGGGTKSVQGKRTDRTP